MIQSILTDYTILPSNSSAIAFPIDDVKTRKATCYGWLQHKEGSPNYKILNGGIYEVSFNASISAAVAGPVAVGLFQDGVLVPGTTSIVTITTPGDFFDISFDKLIGVCCRGNSNLSVQAVPSVLTGVTAPGTPTATQPPIIQNANFFIVKNT